MRAPILSLLALCALPGCDRAEFECHEPPAEGDEASLITFAYQCQSDYMATLAQHASRFSEDPFSAQHSDHLPSVLLKRLGYSADEEFEFVFNPSTNRFVLRADAKGHSTFLDLHNKLRIPIHRIARLPHPSGFNVTPSTSEGEIPSLP